MLENGQNPLENTPSEAPENGNPTGSRPVAAVGEKSVTSTTAPIKKVTEDLYRRIVRRLIRQSTEQRSADILEPVMVSPTMLVEDLYSRKDLEPSSFSTYRSALLWHLSSHRGEPGYAEAEAALNERANSAAGESLPRSKPRRRKVIPESDLHLLIEELTSLSTRSKWSYRTIYWLMAGLATGLRPVEWSSATWEDESHEALILDNAKIKLAAPAFLRKSKIAMAADPSEEEGGADAAAAEGDYKTTVPPTRRVPVTNSNDRFFIEKHLELLAEQIDQGVPLKHYYEQCRRALWRSCRKLWGSKKTYSLYTMRGQYSANQRAAVGSDKTSVLMGHSRPDTPSAAHYGKANQAHKGYADRRGISQQDESVVPTPTQALVMGLPQQ